MKRALYVTLNEIRLYFQDKGDLAFGLLLPIVTFALMYGAFGGQTLFEATARIVDEDGGIYAERLIEQLDEIDGITVEMLTAEEADAKLERSDLLLALVIPAGLSDALTSGGGAELVFRQRGNGGPEGQVLSSIIRGIAGDINQEFQVKRQVSDFVAGEGISAERISVTVESVLADERESPAIGVTEVLAGESGSGDFIVQFLPGIVTMYVLFALTISARAIVEERKRGTLERLLTTRLNAGEMFFGKYISFIARGFIQTLILLALAYAVFQMFTPLSFIYALIIALVFAAAATAIGMIIAAIARSEDGAIWFGVVLTMGMVMLGGTFFEVAEDSVLHTIGRFSINSYANEALRTVITENGTLGDTGFQLMVLGSVAVAGLVIGRVLFKAVPGGK